MSDFPRRGPLPRPPLQVGEAVPREVPKDTTPIHGIEVPYSPRVEEPTPARPGITAQQQFEWNRRFDAVLEVLRKLSVDGGEISATINGIEFRVSSVEQAHPKIEGRVIALEARDREVSLALKANAEAVATASGAVGLVAKANTYLKGIRWILVPFLSIIASGVVGGLVYVRDGLEDRPIKAEVEQIAAASSAAEIALMRVQLERLNVRLDGAIREAEMLREELFELRRRRNP